MGGEITVWEKKNNKISLYAYDGMNILVGATVKGAVVWGAIVLGGNCPKRVIS